MELSSNDFYCPGGVLFSMEKRNRPYEGHLDLFLLFDLEADDFFVFAAIHVSFLSAIKHADSQILPTISKINRRKTANA
jgi:hypothetical protein